MQIFNILKLKSLYILFFVSLFVQGTFAQRQLSELESNSDMRMDSRPDSLSHNDKNSIVPCDIRAWTIDEKFGNILETNVDTLPHLFQNSNHPEGIYGNYNTLGNVGSPRISRVFMLRKPMSKFIFTDPFDMFFVDTEQFRFYNTKSPYMNITYNWCGEKTTGDDHVKVTYTQNAGKKINFGGIFDYIYGQGYYDNQSTAFMNASAWGSYLGEKYDCHFIYQHNFMKMGENGGITDEGYITNPESMQGNYGSSDIPTNLSSTWNRQEHDIVFFNHHYNIGYHKTIEIDSTTTKEEFVPVSRVFHTLKLMKLARNYRAYAETPNYHSFTYLPSDTTNDKTKNIYMKNLVGLSLCEGFNKWAVFGIDAYIGYEYNNYTLPDSISNGGMYVPTARLSTTKTAEHSILLGGQIIRSQGNFINYNVNAELTIGGDEGNIGQFDINGHGEANIPILGDTALIAVDAYIKNTRPSYYLRHFHSKHAWWDNDGLGKEFRQRIEGTMTIPHTKTKLSVGFENIEDFCYFQNTGAILNEGTESQIITNNISVLQAPNTIQVFSVNLRQDFVFGILNFENNFTYQTTSDKDILPLPSISTYHNLYLKFKIAKVLNTEFGADVKYFSKYYAPDYSPVLGQFMNQHEAKKVEIGNYPIVSAYANFLLKRARFYVQYYHANQGTGRYFWAPGYPMNPSGIHFGLSWNFYD